MGLKDMMSKFRASNETIEEVLDDEQAQLDSVTDESDDPEVADNAGTTGDLGAIVEPNAIKRGRAELEETFSDSAELFATQLTIENRIFPAQQGHAASAFLNAKIDDASYGGSVSYVNEEGEVVEGTREQAVRANYASMPKHGLTQKAVKGLKSGDVSGVILAEEPKEPKAEQEDKELTPERRFQLMNKTPLGQQVIANGKGS